MNEVILNKLKALKQTIDIFKSEGLDVSPFFEQQILDEIYEESITKEPFVRVIRKEEKTYDR